MRRFRRAAGAACRSNRSVIALVLAVQLEPAVAGPFSRCKFCCRANGCPRNVLGARTGRRCRRPLEFRSMSRARV
jgi:hypothetical protein